MKDWKQVNIDLGIIRNMDFCKKGALILAAGFPDEVKENDTTVEEFFVWIWNRTEGLKQQAASFILILFSQKYMEME